MLFKFILVLVIVTNGFVHSQRPNEAIDTAFLESVLSAEECDRQISAIRRNVFLGMQFLDAGVRLPKGVLQGGFVDLGNYHQCLAIEHTTNEMAIQGKYCSINVPVDQNLDFNVLKDPLNNWNFNASWYLDKEAMSKIEEYRLMQAEIRVLSGDIDFYKEYQNRSISESPLSAIVFTLGVCVPKPCTTHQAVRSLLFNSNLLEINFKENYCRLRGDKPWTNADIVAVAVFSFIAFITLCSTCYDLFHRFIQNTDIKKINPVYQAFSIYTNGKRLVTYNSGPENLQCIDGIRTLAMMWVIIGHSFSSESFIANPLDSFQWTISAKSLWITAGTMTVDTFFALGGILLVYTTAGKMNGKTLLKNLHWFYMSRIVRITPLLAVTVLLQASFFNHMADGPYWEVVADQTNKCRNYWWYTLLHVQNLLINTDMCVGHTWYIAIDMQLYIISPLVLFWVLTGKRRNAWIALIVGLMTILISSTIFNFINNLQAGVIVPGRQSDDMDDYWRLYYLHPLTRAAPFFVGLIFGYTLHLNKERKVHISWVLAIFLWIVSFGVLGGIFYFKYRILQLDWDNQFMDNFMNSFMRPAWACVIGWIIFACVHGYGGPINWFLTLDLWRLPARLTYAMYLLHYPFMFLINATMVTPIFFSVGGFTFKFLSHLALAAAVAYVFTIIVESPTSTLYKQLLIKVQPRKSPETSKEVVKSDRCSKVEQLNNTQITTDNAAETLRTNVPAVTIK